jgi:hypothetical protein
MDRIKIIIDQEMLVGELYNLRSLLDNENTEAMNKIKNIVELIQNAPKELSKSNYPRTKSRSW